jgi:Rdx family
VAALIKEDSGVTAELVEGRRGEFTVWVDDEIVARKDERGFPSEESAVAAVRAALARP